MTKKYPNVQLRFICAFIMSFALGGTADSADRTAFWPQFHGPNRDNISIEDGLLNVWPETGPSLIWTAEGLGGGYSSLSIVDGRIYTAGNIDGNTVITALDLKGTILWQVENGTAWADSYPGTRSTPTIDGDFLYHESPHGNIICLDAKSGEKIWEVNVLDKYHASNIQWALSESLLIDGDHVICSPGGPEVSMVALDKRTGAVAWTAPSTDELSGYTSAILFESGGLRIVATLTSKSIIIVNADNGELLWRVDHGSDLPQSAAMPLYRDGHLLIVTLNSGSVKWKVVVSGREALIEEVWHNEEFSNHHGGVVMAKGNIYGWSGARKRRKWVCLDWETGEIEHMGSDVERGSITYADGLLYILGAKKGEMGLVRPTESGFELISLFNIPEGGQGPSWAHPVVAGGHLYIRHGTYLYKYDVQASNG